MPDTVKRGDAKTLRLDTGRNLTGVSTARVIISPYPGATPAVDRSGTIPDPAAGIVTLALTTGDYGPTKLYPRKDPFLVEVETEPGPLTHPDDPHAYEKLYVLKDLA